MGGFVYQEGQANDYDNPKVQVSQKHINCSSHYFYYSKSEKNLENSTMTRRPTQATALLSTEVKLSLRTTLDMKVTGFRAKMSGKERESKSGLMVPCTRVGGKQTKPTERED